MSKHKSEDYKISAVKYYLNNDVSLDDVCEIFDCPKQSLYRWVKRYEELEEIKRLSRKPKSYKITKEQVKYSIQKLKENERLKNIAFHNLLHKKNLRFFL
jgi:transposase-like protein